MAITVSGGSTTADAPQWSTEVPDIGWMIENGELIEMPGDVAFLRSRSNQGSCQVYWNRAVAVEQFNEMYAQDASVQTPIT